MAEPDFIIIGAGVVGAAIGYGLARRGQRVLVLEGGDRDFRAARANFGLVWVQGKGAALPAYQRWTRASSDLWPEFDAELSERAGMTTHYTRPGGLAFCLGEEDFAKRTALLQRLHNRDGDADTEMIDRATLQKTLPKMALGPDVTGASFCRRDGHVNPLRLLAALHRAILRAGGEISFRNKVSRIARDGAGYRLEGPSGHRHAGRVVVAAGLASADLVAPLGMGLPLRPERGQVLVTERIAPMLPLPCSGLRQTAEGTMMIGATNENVGLDTSTTTASAMTLARRALRVAPKLRDMRLVRQWSGLRVLSPDGGPVYARSPELPGLWTAGCHSGVTLAAAHADRLAPMLIAGQLSEDIHAFSEKRFDVPLCA